MCGGSSANGDDTTAGAFAAALVLYGVSCASGGTGRWTLYVNGGEGTLASGDVTLAEREDLALETWDGDACEGTSRISGPS